MTLNRRVIRLMLIAVSFLVLPQTNWSDLIARPGDWYGEHHVAYKEEVWILSKNASAAAVLNPHAAPSSVQSLEGAAFPEKMVGGEIPSSSYAVIKQGPDGDLYRWSEGERFEVTPLTLSTRTERKISSLALVLVALGFSYLGIASAEFFNRRVSLLESMEQNDQ